MSAGPACWFLSAKWCAGNLLDGERAESAALSSAVIVKEARAELAVRRTTAKHKGILNQAFQAICERVENVRARLFHTRSTVFLCSAWEYFRNRLTRTGSACAMSQSVVHLC